MSETSDNPTADTPALSPAETRKARRRTQQRKRRDIAWATQRLHEVVETAFNLHVATGLPIAHVRVTDAVRVMLDLTPAEVAGADRLLGAVQKIAAMCSAHPRTDACMGGRRCGAIAGCSAPTAMTPAAAPTSA